MASQIAAQLYTLRDYLKTPADIASTLKKVRQIGYEAVQLSALGPIDPRELNNILKGEGLAVAVTHIPLDRMKNQTADAIADHQLWGCKYTAIGGFFQKSFVAEDWTNFAKDYNEVAKKFEGSGIKIGYHNHSHELVHYNGKPALQTLLESLSKDIWFEIDTYWIAHGGADPVQWINKVKGRIPCIHLKDITIDQEKKYPMMEVGTGNLNWPAILQACKDAGVEWYIIEQDVCPRDPFDCLANSLKNLKAMGIQ
jgi:sugar phosphate isomerase/epimerase